MLRNPFTIRKRSALKKDLIPSVHVRQAVSLPDPKAVLVLPASQGLKRETETLEQDHAFLNHLAKEKGPSAHSVNQVLLVQEQKALHALARSPFREKEKRATNHLEKAVRLEDRKGDQDSQKDHFKKETKEGETRNRLEEVPTGAKDRKVQPGLRKSLFKKGNRQVEKRNRLEEVTTVVSAQKDHRDLTKKHFKKEILIKEKISPFKNGNQNRLMQDPKKPSVLKNLLKEMLVKKSLFKRVIVTAYPIKESRSIKFVI
jgi:hypothetical protein